MPKYFYSTETWKEMKSKEKSPSRRSVLKDKPKEKQIKLEHENGNNLKDDALQCILE